MSKMARFIIWIYSKFTRKEIEQIIAAGLSIFSTVFTFIMFHLLLSIRL